AIFGPANADGTFQRPPITANTFQSLPTLNAIATEPNNDVAPGKTAQPASFIYSWSVTRDGAAYTLPAGVVTNQQTFSFVPTATGQYAINVTATDTVNNGLATASVYVVVISGNPGAQIIVAPGTTAVPEGTTIHLGNNVTDLTLASPFT